MILLHGVCTVLVACMACAQLVPADSVTLSADSLLIPGGYVVPERGNITFTCNSSSGGVLLWTVDLQIQDSKVVDTPSRSLNITLPNVSSLDTMIDANPASFTIHYIAPESNGSSVKCLDGTALATSSAMILVEGFPNCPTIQNELTSESLTISMQKSRNTWLPMNFSAEVTSFNASVVTVYNSTSTSNTSFDVSSLQSDTVYNISVTPCNIVGCNESCDIHSVQTLQEKPIPRDGGALVQLSLTIGVPIMVVITLLLVVILASLLLICLIRRRKNRHKRNERREGLYEDIVAVDSAYDDVLALSATLRDHAVSQLPVPGLELGSEGYEVMHSAPQSLGVRKDGTHEEQSSRMGICNVRQTSSPVQCYDARPSTKHLYQEPTLGVTSTDVVMEDNPSYQQLEVASAKISVTMENSC